MNILVISGHPDEESYCHELALQYVQHIDAERHQVTLLDLAKMNFDPVLRYGYRKRMEEDEEILRSQELLLWADHLVFVYPVWWSSMPSLMKGWIDRVFTPGIAYSSNTDGPFLLNFLRGRQFKKRLKGKTAEIIVTSMAPAFWYKLFSGVLSIPDSYGVAVLKKAVLNHCGIKTKQVMVLGDMGRTNNTESKRINFLQEIARLAERVK